MIEYICLVLINERLKDSLGRQRFRQRIPLIGEEIKIHQTYFRVTRVIHTPEENYAAEICVERVDP